MPIYYKINKFGKFNFRNKDMKINNILLSLCGVIILSGCTYKAELVSHKDESVHYGTMNDFSDTFDITIRGKKYVGDWLRGFVIAQKVDYFKLSIYIR